MGPPKKLLVPLHTELGAPLLHFPPSLLCNDRNGLRLTMTILGPQEDEISFPSFSELVAKIEIQIQVCLTPKLGFLHDT